MIRALPGMRPGLFVLLAMAAVTARAQEPMSQEKVDPIVYRRLFVPEEDLPKQARGLLPMKRDEFEQRIKAARRSGGQVPSQGRIENGAYRATFRDGQLLEGTAEVNVSCPSGDKSFVGLGEVNVAITSAQWNEDPPRSALLGLSDSGTYVLQAASPAQLKFSWMAAGQPSDGGSWAFDVALPQANRSELQLDLPEGWSLTTASALLREPAPLVPGEKSNEANEPPASKMRWTLEVGGASRIQFLVHPPSASRAESLLLVSETASYRFAPGLLDAEVSLDLTVHQQPLREMALRVDPGLNVLSIRSGSHRLSWLEGAPDENGVRRYTVELPEPLAVGSHTLQIAATSEWLMEEEKRLPRILVERGLWQTGTVALIETSGVRISAESQDGASQLLNSGTEATPGALRFEYFSSTSRIDVVASRPRPRLNVESGLSLALDSGQATATLIADFSTAKSLDAENCFDISAVAPRGWIIESVETVPSDLLEDRTLTLRRPDSHRLLVRLRRPIRADAPTRVIVRARRQRLRDTEVNSSDLLRFLTFHNVGVERRLISVVTTDSTMEPALLSDSQSERRDPATLSPYERTLLETPQGAILIDTPAPGSVGRLALRRNEAQYSAEIESAVRVSQNSISNEIRILVRPEVSSISRVLVRVMPRPRGKIDWTVEGNESQTVVAKEFSSRTGDDDDESLLQLQLSGPQSGTMVLIGRWSYPFDGKVHLPLLSLPEATSQSGTIQIATGRGIPVSIAADRMSALPLPPVADDTINPLLARYQYEPGSRGELIISPRIPPRSLGLFLRERIVSSKFSSDGSASHVAVYELDNLGEGRFALNVPAGASIKSVTVDKHPAAIVGHAESGEQLVVSLPDTVRRPRVTLQYSSPPQDNSHWFASKFRAPLPQTDIPALRERWTVRLAPGLHCWTTSAPPGEQHRSWNQVFDLFSRRDWARLWSSTMNVGVKERLSIDSDLEEIGKGWREYEFTLSDEPYETLLVYRPVWVSICGIALALCIVAVATALPDRYMRAGLVAATCFTAATFWLSPMPLIPISWWALAGIVTSAVWQGLKSSENGSQATQRLDLSTARRTPFVSGTLLPVLLLLAVLPGGHGARCAAEEFAIVPSNEAPRVVFPVDEDQQPTGDYVYLSEDLYEFLHQASAPQRSNDPTWLVTSAQYSVSFAEEESSVRPSACEIVVEYEVHTFGEATRVQLPLGNGDVHLVASASTLNESPAVFSWNEAHDVLSVEVPDAGDHRLTLRLGVASKRHDEHFVVNVPIPKVPQSKASLLVDADRGQGELASAQRGHAFVTVDGTLEADLVPSGQLHVRYLPNEVNSSPRSTVSVAQRIWWKMRPGSVLAEGRFDFSTEGGELREIVLRTDPRVRLLPLDSDAGIVRRWTEEGPFNTVHLELAPPYPVEASLHARFLVVGATGSGTFVPPAIHALADRTDRYLEALSVTPGWEVEGPSDQLTLPAFIRAWGGAPEPPAIAWDRASLLTVPTIVIRPSPKQLTANQNLDFSLGRDIGRLFYRAEFRQEEQPLRQCSLAMPPNLRVRTVTGFAGDKPLPAEWWQSDQSSLTVRFSDSQSRPTQLSVEADWDLPGQRSPISLPLVRLQSVDASNYEVRVFRESNVSVKWEGKSGLVAADDSLLGGYVSNRGRLEAHFVADRHGERQVRLRVEPSAPKLVGRLLTAVHEVNKSWIAELHCDLQVRSGSLDVLRFEVPDHWSGPFNVEPAVDHTLLTLPGQSRKQLVIRPQRAITDRLTLVIRGPLKASAADSIRAVDVQLLDAQSVDRYLALAKSSHFTWETNGLQPSQNSASIFPATLSSERYQLFRVIADRSEAIGRRPSLDKQTREPLVRLADIQAAWQQDRRYFGTARFDLHPEGMPECTLSVPADCQVAAVTLDDVRAEINAVGPRALRIDLGGRQLPVQLKVSFVGRLPFTSSTDDSIELPAPQLKAIPVERTVWTISLESEGAKMMPANEALLTSAERVELERMASGLAALRDLADESDGSASAYLRDGAPRWNSQYDHAAGRLQHLIRSNGGAEADVTKEIDRLDLQRSELIEGNEYLSSSGMTRPAVAGPPDSGEQASYAMSDGSLATLSFRYSNGLKDSRIVPRQVFAGWTILGLIGLALLRGRGTAFVWLKANSWLAVAMLGIATAFLFPGNPAGWLIALAGSVFAVWRWPWAGDDVRRPRG